jgi:GT2 family glycosyltransferase
MQPKVTVVIPNWNGAAWLPGCLDALRLQDFRDFETVLVDNGSVDDSLAVARARVPDIRVLVFPENRGFAAAANAGIAAARGDYVALLNTDTVARPHWLGRLVEALEAAPPDVAGLASRIVSLSDPTRLDDTGDFLNWYGIAIQRGHGDPVSAFFAPDEVFSACAAAALYRRSVLEELDGFDEHFFAYLEDLDLGLRARLRGYRWLYVPGAEVQHQGHGSGTPARRYVRLMSRNRLLLLTKSLPLRLLLRHAPQLLYGQLYFAVAYRRPFASLAGYLDYLKVVPHVLRARRTARRTRRISPAQLEPQLRGTAREPPLSHLLARRLRRVWP